MREHTPQLRVPDVLRSSHRLEGPRRMVVAGEAYEAVAITEITKDLRDRSWMFDSMCFSSIDTALTVLALEHGQGKERIFAEHPTHLTAGYGLEQGQSTEALFVGPVNRQLSLESAVWLGRAISASHIEKVYYLDQSLQHDGAGITGIGSELSVIINPLDVFRVVSTQDGSEIPYTKAVALQEAIS